MQLHLISDLEIWRIWMHHGFWHHGFWFLFHILPKFHRCSVGLWNESTAEPMLPEDSLLRLSLSTGDGLIGMTLVEHDRPAVTSKPGFQVQKEKLYGNWRWKKTIFALWMFSFFGCGGWGGLFFGFYLFVFFFVAVVVLVVVVVVFSLKLQNCQRQWCRH